VGWGTVGTWSIYHISHTPARTTPAPHPRAPRSGGHPGAGDTHGSVDGGDIAARHDSAGTQAANRTFEDSEYNGTDAIPGPRWRFADRVSRLRLHGGHDDAKYGRHARSASEHSSSDHQSPKSRRLGSQNTHTTTLRCIILYNIAHYVHKYYCLQIILEFSSCDTCDGWRRVNECSRVGGWSPDHLVPDCTFNCWRG